MRFLRYRRIISGLGCCFVCYVSGSVHGEGLPSPWPSQPAARRSCGLAELLLAFQCIEAQSLFRYLVVPIYGQIVKAGSDECVAYS